MNLADHTTTVLPWWQRSRVPWTGQIFDRMILQPDSPEQGRIQSIRQSLLDLVRDGKRRLSVTQALIITQSYQHSEGQHPAMRRAKAMRAVFQHIPISLMPGQLLMGTASSGPGILDFNPTFLPISPHEWDAGGELTSPLHGAEELYVLSSDERQRFDQQIWPYWRTRCKEAYLFNELKQHHAQAWHYLLHGQFYRWSPLVGTGLAHTIQDYASVLRKGLRSIQEEIGAHMAPIDAGDDHSLASYDRRNNYAAMIVAAEGMIEYAQRNAELADSLAQRESDPARAAELREMARICRKVPAEPAESWWEALQSFHFLRLGTAMAEGADSHAAGRFDQYMLPYLQHDLEAGALSRATAQELLECLFLKWNETRRFAMSRGSTGGGNNDKLNLGGMDEHGHDCTNELSYMLLEAHAHVHLNDPNLSVRLHNGTPHEFLQQVLEVLRLGGGLPILLNDEVVVPALTSTCGVRLDHARQYGDLGCQENVTDPNMTGADTNGRTNAGWVALPKPIELALFNGVNPSNGIQVGPQTGDATTFATSQAFLDAVRAQIEHAVDMNVRANNAYDHVFTRYFPCVFHNLMHPGPRASGVDINAGGCLYNWAGPLCVGMANAGDMLAAIDHLVFRTKRLTWDELLEALQNDWQGCLRPAGVWRGADEIRQAFIAAPKYGCDDEYADGWVRTMLGMYFDAYERHPTSRGGHFVVGLMSMSNYVALGRWLGATPDGRRAGMPLADATSPSSLAPAAGPTATHRSAARAIDAYHVPNGVTFNQRFATESVSTPRELSKWADLVRSYMEDGGLQVQYTVVSGEDLRQAQQHPEQYRDLIVRVGGYSAVFVELSREMQDTIIARAELAL